MRSQATPDGAMRANSSTAKRRAEIVEYGADQEEGVRRHPVGERGARSCLTEERVLVLMPERWHADIEGGECQI